MHGSVRPASVRLSDDTEVELAARVPVAEAIAQLRTTQAALLAVPIDLMASVAAPYDGADADDAATLEAATVTGLFDADRRVSLPGSLHRISAAVGRDGRSVVGLTYRVGHHVDGAAAPLGDILAHAAAVHRGRAAGKCFTPPRSAANASGAGGVLSARAALAAALGGDGGSGSAAGAGLGGSPSILLLGRPGAGKTTVLRDVARALSGLGLRTIVVDTSAEIAGDGDEPHPCIGGAVRLHVPHNRSQADVMLEAVQNHGPDVVVVDEIGTRAEAEAARTISQRGVILVATAHGTQLADVLRNPELARLVGGVTSVQLGDKAADAARGGAKTRLERGGAAVFQVLVELQSRARWRVHLSVEGSVDALLAGARADAHVRSGFEAAAAAGSGGSGTDADGGNGALPPASADVVFETRQAAQQAAVMAAEAAAAAGERTPSGILQVEPAGQKVRREGEWLTRLLLAAIDKAPAF